MDYDAFNEFCASLPCTNYVVQWGGAHVWKVGTTSPQINGGKLFAIGGWSGTNKTPAFSFKTSDLDFQFLQHKDGYKPAPYFANRGMKWIQCTDAQNAEELRYYLSESHRLASLNLTKKLQRELGLNISVS